MHGSPVSWYTVGAAVAVGLVLALSGCIIDKMPYAGVNNLTDRRVVVTGTLEGIDDPVKRRADPRQVTPLFSGGEECRQVALEFASAGEEPFAQFNGSLCSEQNLVVEAGEVTVRGW